jgi:hypothetical protein
MAAKRWENNDPERAKIEYAAEVMAHELCLSLKALVQDTGALQPADNHGVELGLLAVADALREVAAAIREGRGTRPY